MMYRMRFMRATVPIPIVGSADVLLPVAFGGSSMYFCWA